MPQVSRGVFICSAVVAGALICIGAVVGLTYYFTTQSDRSESAQRLDRNYTPGDYVEVVFHDSINQKFERAFLVAAKKWSAVVNGTKIVPERVTDINGQNPTFNGVFGCAAVSDYRLSTSIIDHLFILAEVTHIDGPSGVLGQATPCNWFGITEGTYEQFTPNTRVLPNIGFMQFDEADVERMYDQGTLDQVILHEMGHVLGFGTFWNFDVQNNEGEVIYSQQLLQDPIFSETAINPGNEPSFSGENAKQEWSRIQDGDVGNVPVEDGCCDSNGLPYFDLLNGEGQGTVDGHWKETIFGTELMTGFLNSDSNPLSLMTIQSLRDLGYTVNPEEADPYLLTSSRRLGAPKVIMMKDVYPLKRFKNITEILRLKREFLH